MLRLFLGRLASFAVTLAAASGVVFFVLDLLPGNAAAVLLGTAARPDTLEVLTRQLGLDRPAPQRYGAWVLGMLHGDFGQSATYGVSAGRLLAERLPVTLPLAAIALALAATLGIGLGLLAGGRPDGVADRAAVAFARIGLAVPDFWVGLLLILLFSTTLHWFAAGGFPGWWPHPLEAVRALILPAVALALPQAAVLVRVTRAAVLEVGHSDFVRTARSKGLSEWRILWAHAARNALVPVVTILGLQASFLVAGAVLVENVFSLPGLGRLATQALAQRDLVVIRAIAMTFAATVIAVNLLVDLAYLAIDPRLRERP